MLRSLDHARIDMILQRRNEWGRKMNPGSWLHAWKPLEISDQQRKNLHDLCDFLLSNSSPRKIMFSGDWAYIYTTDPKLVNDLRTLNYLNQSMIRIQQAQQVGTPGTVRLKNVQHENRSYFHNMSVDAQQRQNLREFLYAQPDIRIGPSLRQALENPGTKRLFDYYFIDHDGTGMIMMLNLMVPGIIRRTLPIVADK